MNKAGIPNKLSSQSNSGKLVITHGSLNKARPTFCWAESKDPVLAAPILWGPRKGSPATVKGSAAGQKNTGK